jgi:ankyrin repeat protein
LDLQNLLLSISAATYAQVRDSLFATDYLTDQRLPELSHLLVKTLDYRPRQTEFYVNLTADIAQQNPRFLILLTELLLGTNERKIRRLFYLHGLTLRCIIPISEVLTFIHRIFADKAFVYMNRHRKLCLGFFCWFASEIESEDPARFRQYCDVVRTIHDSPYFKSLTSLNLSFQKNLEELSQNHWAAHRARAQLGASADEIAIRIRNDDPFEPEAVDAVVETNIFECSGFLNHRPTLLQYTAFHGSIRCFRNLLALGADRSIRDKKKRSLQDFAVAGGSPEIIAEVFGEARETSPVSEAAGPIAAEAERVGKSGRRKVGSGTGLAMEVGAEHTFSSAKKRQHTLRSEPKLAPVFTDQSSAHEHQGDSNLIVAKFNRFGVIPPSAELSAFLRCCKSNCLRLLIHCVENGVDPNSYDESTKKPAITIAAQNGCVEIVKYLSRLDGINLSALDSTCGTPLIAAASNGHLPVVRYLSSLPAVDINAGDERETTPLIWASMKGHLSVVEFLCQQRGIDYNAMDEYYGPSFVHAAMHGHLDVVRYLATRERFGLNMKGDYVGFAITYAANHGYLDVVKYLATKEGANFNLKNIYDENALTSAVAGHQLEMIRYLAGIDGIDLNNPGPDGNSPFLAAATHGDLPILKFLAGLPGVDIRQRNAVGATVLKVARMYKHPEVIDYLETLRIGE